MAGGTVCFALGALGEFDMQPKDRLAVRHDRRFPNDLSLVTDHGSHRVLKTSG
jgi:hypothetical protein